MGFILSADFDDWTALGLTAAVGHLKLWLHAPITDADTGQVVTTQPFYLALEGGAGSIEVPTIPPGNALVIQSAVPGFAGQFLVRDPGIPSISLIGLLTHFSVDPSTLVPLSPTPLSALEALAVATLKAAEATQAAADAARDRLAAEDSAEASAQSATDAENTADGITDAQNVFIQSNRPTFINTGLWWDTSGGNLTLWIEDGE